MFHHCCLVLTIYNIVFINQKSSIIEVFLRTDILGIPLYVLLITLLIVLITILFCCWYRECVKQRILINGLLLFEFVLIVLFFTLIFRPPQPSFIKKEIFVGYIEYCRGGNIPYENIMNIILFMPIGYLLPNILKNKITIVICVGFLFSIFIESMQLFYKRGIFDYNDILNNSIGCATGLFISHLLTKKRKRLHP